MTKTVVTESNEYFEEHLVFDDQGNVIHDIHADLIGPPLAQGEKEFYWIAGEIEFRGANTIEEARERVKDNLAADPNYYDQFDWI